MVDQADNMFAQSFESLLLAKADDELSFFVGTAQTISEEGPTEPIEEADVRMVTAEDVPNDEVETFKNVYEANAFKRESTEQAWKPPLSAASDGTRNTRLIGREGT